MISNFPQEILQGFWLAGSVWAVDQLTSVVYFPISSHFTVGFNGGPTMGVAFTWLYRKMNRDVAPRRIFRINIVKFK